MRILTGIVSQTLVFATLYSSAFTASGQVRATNAASIGQYVIAKEFSKEIALYRAKAYVMKDVLGPSNEVVKFDIDPLAASNSGELTSLVYQSPSQNKEGLILGFYGDRWNAEGVVYQSYAFKNLPKEKALELLALIDKNIADNSTYMLVGGESSNIYFQYDDMTFLFTRTSGGTIKTRVFWNDFDADWEALAYQRTKKRLTKKLN